MRKWERQAYLISSGRSEEALEDLAAEIQQRGGEAVVTVCDHADVEATEEIFRKIDQMVGKASLNDNMWSIGGGKSGSPGQQRVWRCKQPGG